MNTTMHGHLKNQGSDPAAIQDRIRKGMFAEKVKKWPAELTGVKIKTPNKTLEAIFRWRKLRDEVTHPKIDHSLYNQLAAVEFQAMRPIVAEFIIRLLKARSELYPYWLLGWNFTTGPDTTSRSSSPTNSSSP